MKTGLIALFIVAAFSVSGFGQSRSGLEGVWSLTEITTTGDSGSTRKMSQPSMYLFTKNHYSIIYVSGDSPRADVEADKATADELRDTFVKSFVANAGTYEFKGGKLTLHPMVAKSPGYMKAGNWNAYMVKSDGKTATFVSDSSNNGPSTNPTTFRLMRVE